MIAFPNWIHFKFIFLYICLPGPGLSCGLWDLGPWPRIEPGLHWECGVLALDHEKNPWIYFKGTMRAWWHYFQLVPHEAGLYSILCCYSYNRDGGGSGTMCGRSTTERSTAPNVLLLFSVFLMNSTFKAQVSPYFLQPWAQPVPSPLISLWFLLYVIQDHIETPFLRSCSCSLPLWNCLSRWPQTPQAALVSFIPLLWPGNIIYFNKLSIARLLH